MIAQGHANAPLCFSKVERAAGNTFLQKNLVGVATALEPFGVFTHFEAIDHLWNRREAVLQLTLLELVKTALIGAGSTGELPHQFFKVLVGGQICVDLFDDLLLILVIHWNEQLAKGHRSVLGEFIHVFTIVLTQLSRRDTRGNGQFHFL